MKGKGRCILQKEGERDGRRGKLRCLLSKRGSQKQRERQDKEKGRERERQKKTLSVSRLQRTAAILKSNGLPRPSLWKSFEDGVHLFGHCRQRKLKLFLCLHHAGPLVSQVLQGSSNINLFSTFSHLIENHVNQDVCSTSPCAITAVDYNWTRSSPVALVNLSTEVQQGAC